MSTNRKGTGAEFLARQSELVRTRGRLPQMADILIVGAEPASANIIGAMLRLMFGYETAIRPVGSFGAALDAVVFRTPDLILLDERVSPTTTALEALPILRRCDYAGPVLVIARAPDRALQRALLDAGAADVLDRDELDSARIAEALLRAHLPEAVAAE
jgi:CheY-like chemotaxis protein